MAMLYLTMDEISQCILTSNSIYQWQTLTTGHKGG